MPQFDALSAYENVMTAMQLAGCPPEEMRRRGVAILERLGLGGRIDHKPRSLSKRVRVRRDRGRPPDRSLPRTGLDTAGTGAQNRTARVPPDPDIPCAYDASEWRGCSGHRPGLFSRLHSIAPAQLITASPGNGFVLFKT